jgi:hypothetical protein
VVPEAEEKRYPVAPRLVEETDASPDWPEMFKEPPWMFEVTVRPPVEETFAAETLPVASIFVEDTLVPDAFVKTRVGKKP